MKMEAPRVARHNPRQLRGRSSAVPQLSEVSLFCRISVNLLLRFDRAQFRTSILPRAVYRLPLWHKISEVATQRPSDDEWGMAPFQLLLAAARV
jgi:hypothetical protein